MKVFFALLLFCTAQFAVAQTETENFDVAADSDFHYMLGDVDDIPQFPDGGLPAFQTWVTKNYKLPNPDSKGMIFVSFMVEKDGSITHIGILRDLGHGTGEEAVRLMESSPKWIPAKVKGLAVRCKYQMPIRIGNGFPGKPEPRADKQK